MQASKVSHVKWVLTGRWLITNNFIGLLCLSLVLSLTHSRLRMPQSSPGQGRGMPPGSISRGFDMLSGHP